MSIFFSKRSRGILCEKVRKSQVLMTYGTGVNFLCEFEFSKTKVALIWVWAQCESLMNANFLCSTLCLLVPVSVRGVKTLPYTAYTPYRLLLPRQPTMPYFKKFSHWCDFKWDSNHFLFVLSVSLSFLIWLEVTIKRVFWEIYLRHTYVFYWCKQSVSL